GTNRIVRQLEVPSSLQGQYQQLLLELVQELTADVDESDINDDEINLLKERIEALISLAIDEQNLELNSATLASLFQELSEELLSDPTLLCCNAIFDDCCFRRSNPVRICANKRKLAFVLKVVLSEI
ncbi:unnamed protein product, partial [Didymodactylos carnosus]